MSISIFWTWNDLWELGRRWYDVYFEKKKTINDIISWYWTWIVKLVVNGQWSGRGTTDVQVYPPIVKFQRNDVSNVSNVSQNYIYPYTRSSHPSIQLLFYNRSSSWAMAAVASIAKSLSLSQAQWLVHKDEIFKTPVTPHWQVRFNFEKRAFNLLYSYIYIQV